MKTLQIRRKAIGKVSLHSAMTDSQQNDSDRRIRLLYAWIKGKYRKYGTHGAQKNLDHEWSRFSEVTPGGFEPPLLE